MPQRTAPNRTDLHIIEHAKQHFGHAPFSAHDLYMLTGTKKLQVANVFGQRLVARTQDALQVCALFPHLLQRVTDNKYCIVKSTSE